MGGEGWEVRLMVDLAFRSIGLFGLSIGLIHFPAPCGLPFVSTVSPSEELDDVFESASVPVLFTSTFVRVTYKVRLEPGTQ